MSAHTVKLTWYGTASLSLRCADGGLLIDPFFPLNGSETRVPPNAYAPFRHILVTHGHFDHILCLPQIVRESGATVYCTETPRQTLLKKGVPEAQLSSIAPGDGLEIEGFRVAAFQSRHVQCDNALLRRTFLNPRMLRYAANVPRIARENRICRENGETLTFLFERDGRRVLSLGSLGLDADTEYPTGVDLLVLPYQGTSDLLTPALRIIDRLKPRAVAPDHWDDTFPPISSHIYTAELKKALPKSVRFIPLQPGESLEL